MKERAALSCWDSPKDFFFFRNDFPFQFFFFFSRFNSIQALSETSFAGLTKLELLMVHGNDIPSIPDGALRDLISLQVSRAWQLPRWFIESIPLPMRETRVRSLGREDAPEEGMATHCSLLAWRIPWTEEPAGLQSMGS